MTNLNPPSTPHWVVVVGCNGFIGKSLTTKLTELGIDHIGLSKEEFNSLDEKASEKLKRVIQPRYHLVVTSAITLSKSPTDLQESIKMEVAQKRQEVLSTNSQNERQGSESEILIMQLNASRIHELFPKFRAKDLDTRLRNWKNQI